jgi:electron transfer flavoprotein alpha subunit
MLSDKKVISMLPNSYKVVQSPVETTVEKFSVQIPAGDLRAKVTETVRSTDKISLPEAELVVSAGRGMKGPENWGMIEELADVLGAATACSKPVSDAGWRPHSEHVGQTGIAISPNLYIAVGISGAIQHLAGISSSKVIVVINKDPEAPFFKSADYGIVGDAMEVVPALITAAKAFKENQN